MGCRKQEEMEITRCGTCSTISLFFHIDIARSTPGEQLGGVATVHLHVVGSHERLGAWDPEHAIRLTTSERAYPVWRSQQIDLRCEPEESFLLLKYKYVLDRRELQQGFLWEENIPDREVRIPWTPGADLGVWLIRDTAFNNQGPSTLRKLDLNSVRAMRVKNNSQSFVSDEPGTATFMSVLRDAGYTTMLVGKDHLSDAVEDLSGAGQAIDMQALGFDWIGALLTTLHDLAPDAVVVVTGDHGEHLGDHGHFAKASPWEPSIHVPLIIAGATIAPHVEEHPVSLIDVPRTLLDLAAVRPAPSMQGYSLAPALERNGKALLQRPAVMSGLNYLEHFDSAAALLEGSFLKLVCCPSGCRKQGRLVPDQFSPQVALMNVTSSGPEFVARMGFEYDLLSAAKKSPPAIWAAARWLAHFLGDEFREKLLQSPQGSEGLMSAPEETPEAEEPAVTPLFDAKYALIGRRPFAKGGFSSVWRCRQRDSSIEFAAKRIDLAQADFTLTVAVAVWNQSIYWRKCHSDEDDGGCMQALSDQDTHRWLRLLYELLEVVEERFPVFHPEGGHGFWNIPWLNPYQLKALQTGFLDNRTSLCLLAWPALWAQRGTPAEGLGVAAVSHLRAGQATARAV
eukprot:g22128.t1